MSLFDVVLFIGFAFGLLIFYFKHKFNFWKNLGVPFVKPRIPYGNIQGQLKSCDELMMNKLRKYFLKVIAGNFIHRRSSQVFITNSSLKESLVEFISSQSR